jgi:hypothetical protein
MAGFGGVEDAKALTGAAAGEPLAATDDAKTGADDVALLAASCGLAALRSGSGAGAADDHHQKPAPAAMITRATAK